MISKAAPRSTCEANLIIGILGSGKTWNLTTQLLQAAKEKIVAEGSSLLALSRPNEREALRGRVDLERPLGCSKCEITTFPTIVRRIVHDFGPTVGSYTPADARVLDSDNLAVFLHRNLDKLPLGSFRPLHTPGDAVRPLIHLFSGLAHLGVAPEEYLKYVENLESELEAGDEQIAALASSAKVDYGDIDQTAVGSSAAGVRSRQRARLEAEAWRNHVAGERDKANSYEAFVDLKRREEVADYGDQLLLARKILKENPSAQAELSLRLSHIYVDDLHDYSPAMVDILLGLVAPGVGITATVDPLLAAMSSGSTAGHPSAGHAVGPKYAALARFREAFPETVDVRLDDFRQRANAIQVSMRALMPRDVPVAGPKSETKSGRTCPSTEARDSKSTPGDRVWARSSAAAESALTCLTFPSEADELQALGKRIRDILDHQGLSPRDIGVAAIGGRKAVDTLIAALRSAGVRADSERKASIVFENETPRMLMSFLRCLLHPSESTPLLHLLMTCPAYALPEGELNAALEEHLSRYVPLRSFLQNSNSSVGSVEPQDSDGLPTRTNKVATRLLSDLSRFEEAAKKRGIREVMLEFLRHTGQLERLEEPTTLEEEREGRAVAEFLEVVAMAEKQAGSDHIAAVEPILRLFRRHGVRRAGCPGKDEGDLTVMPSAIDSEVFDGKVHVFQPGMYSEDAAGRSFHVVFIPFCSRARLPGPLRKARLSIPGPFRGALEPRDAASIRSEAELARVCHENRARAMLYAAIGCAREEVCLSVSAQINRGRNHLTPSPFLAEIFGEDAPREWKAPAPPVSQRCVDFVSMREGQEAMGNINGMGLPPRVLRDNGIKSDIGEFQPLRLSFSSISSYNSCPHSYYLQYVLHVSPPPTPRMVYGRAMHEAVAALLRAVVAADAGGTPPTLQMAVEEFHANLSGCSFESATQARTLRANGVAGLASFLSRLLEGQAGSVRMVDYGNGGSTWKHTDFEVKQQSQLLVERKFLVKVPEAHVIMSGIFDRVDVVLPGSHETAASSPLVFITEYKSNVGDKDPARMVRDNLQLRVYSLAAERLFGALPAELTIESIEDGRRGVTAASRIDLELALEEISMAASAIRAQEFDATPSFQACTFCGFKHMCRYSVVKNTAL